ncbi:MAG: TetR family transcriptional regulator [Burkholderiales bacterium RIFCSPHIGHO2_12_FULL_67_38]|nr:MAG: TetR family transcriptional regulator [Burkholderiales bacterium RIFCSPLOWO2_02_FULL_67_64]OGB41547.1 MAG: TetR family transcriptional regulator [Burkholderiales bacterium RIFCSPHIGHO2_12_FULL_67_38]OGB96749.1 MAG: TetR family transcriptional regulator [Burkholderiales bacterium RIFCSPLOWO2_12_FULL_67_210]
MATRPLSSSPKAKPASARGTPRPDRQMAILLAAEKLFSQRGYHGVTIREIAVEAGVPLALVGYYFGPKHELFHAIFVHWQGTAEQRLTQLQDVTQGPVGPDRLRQVVEAFVRPVLAQRASAEGEYYAQLVGRELSRQTPETQRVLNAFFDPLAHRFIDALQAARPGSQRATAAWAYQFALGALLHHISDHRMPALSRGENASNDPAAGDLLIDFITAGIAAVLPHAPSPRRRAPSSSTTRRHA